MTVETILEQARREKRAFLNEIESKEFMQEAGVPVTQAVLATSEEEVAALASKLGFPVALKVMSNDIVHKSDAGGVKLGLKDGEEAKSAYREIMASAKQYNPDAVIQGVSVQQMARPGQEVIIGMTRDAQFGPVLMFGIGGVMVEVMKDVSFRLVPLKPADAAEMVREIKGYPLLDGFRGSEPCDVPYLEQMLLGLSAFIEQHPEIKELDLNPVFAYKEGAMVVDARVILEDTMI